MQPVIPICRVTVHSARNVPTGEMMFRANPLVAVQLGDAEKRTEKAEVTEAPAWNQTFDFPYHNEQTIKFSLFGKRVVRTVLLGSTTLTLSPIYLHPNKYFQGEVTVTNDEDQTSAYVLLTIEFFPKSEAAAVPMAVAPSQSVGSLRQQGEQKQSSSAPPPSQQQQQPPQQQQYQQPQYQQQYQQPQYQQPPQQQQYQQPQYQQPPQQQQVSPPMYAPSAAPPSPQPPVTVMTPPPQVIMQQAPPQVIYQQPPPVVVQSPPMMMPASTVIVGGRPMMPGLGMGMGMGLGIGLGMGALGGGHGHHHGHHFGGGGFGGGFGHHGHHRF